MSIIFLSALFLVQHILDRLRIYRMSEVPFKAGVFYVAAGGWPAEILSVGETILVKHYLPHGMLQTMHHLLDGTHLHPTRAPHALTLTTTVSPW